MSNEPMITVWVTKYAMTAGISRLQVEDHGKGMVFTGGRFGYFVWGEGKDWHRTPESALARVEAMRTAKIASLRKQIEKLQRKVFAAPAGDEG